MVSPAPVETRADPQQFWGSLKGSVTYIAPDFDEPLGDEAWEAVR